MFGTICASCDLKTSAEVWYQQQLSRVSTDKEIVVHSLNGDSWHVMIPDEPTGKDLIFGLERASGQREQFWKIFQGDELVAEAIHKYDSLPSVPLTLDKNAQFYCVKDRTPSYQLDSSCWRERAFELAPEELCVLCETRD